MVANMQLRPANDLCIDCGSQVDVKKERQEMAWEADGTCRRRCGSCIEKNKKKTLTQV